jgi:hypothetical protein
MTTGGDDGTPEVPGGTGRKAFRPRGAARYLDKAVDILRPNSAEERARDRAWMEHFAASFLEHRHVATHGSRLLSDVRLELRELAPAAERLLKRLAKLSRPARQELENEYEGDVTLRRLVDEAGPGAEALPDSQRLSRLKDDLALLAVLAETAAEGRVKGKGGGASERRVKGRHGGAAEKGRYKGLNYHTTLLGNPLRWLAFEAARRIDAYRRGRWYGIRARPHLKITGQPGGHVHELARAVAAYALGEEPEEGLDDAVERAVADWKKAERNRLLLKLEAQCDARPLSESDKALKAIIAETDARIAAKRRRK